MQAIDLYAAANPAFGAILLHAYVQGYTSRQQVMPFVMAFLPLPLALSKPVADAMQGTNVRKGFLAWIADHPGILPRMPERIVGSRGFSQSSLRFAVHHRLLVVADANVAVNTSGPWRKARWPASDDRGAALRRARRLGIWFGELNAPHIILGYLGVRP